MDESHPAGASRLGVDTGGTFTDVVASDGRAVKLLSTPDDPARAVAEGITLAGGAAVLTHGTTVATNALLTGATARVVLVTTRGFRDVLGYRNGSRPAVYDLTQPRPVQLVRRRDRIEVAERLSEIGRAHV